MNIVVTGGSGFIGANLCGVLIAAGHTVTALGTRNRHRLEGTPNFNYLNADTTQTGAWQQEIRGMNAAVNLAGRTIFHRWTDRYKEEIYNSRIRTTRNLVDAISGQGPMVLVNASAVGYYGDRGDTVLTEDAAAGNDFLARVSTDWEATARMAQGKGARVVLTRFGVVLGKGGGALEKLVPAFKMMAGGPIGDGSQWFSWIHLEDLLRCIRFVLENETAEGPFNFVSPGVLRNREFVQALASVLRRPAFIPAPAFMIRAALGEMASVVLSSQRCRPERLQSMGFTFQYPELTGALKQLLGS